MDEAGTSQHEPVTVVVGLIANADEHIALAEAMASEAIGAVPKRFQQDFVFHATEVFGDKKYHDDWSLTDRIGLLTQMMSIPRKVGLAITVTAVWRDSLDPKISASQGFSSWQLDHIMAFKYCVAVADRNIRRHAGANEVATIVAEDVPEMRRHLNLSYNHFRDNPVHLSPHHLRETQSDIGAGHITQSGELRVARIRKGIHFVEKADDPIVQLADACAYGFRRFFAGEKFGVEFVRAIVGHENALSDFAAPSGTACFWPK